MELEWKAGELGVSGRKLSLGMQNQTQPVPGVQEGRLQWEELSKAAVGVLTEGPAPDEEH